MEPMVILRGRGLSKSFGTTPALRDVDVEVRRGEVLAIRGASGSGKSTLLQCLAGIVLPENGQVLLKGNDLTLLSEHERAIVRRREFGFVFQFGQLVPELSMIENVALPLRLDGVRGSAARAAGRELLDSLGVGPLADRRPGEVSGGEAQRVALARALIAQPSIVFADEPTGALDTRTGRVVLDLLVTAVDHGASVVLVTHDSGVARRADREVWLEDGQVRVRSSAGQRPLIAR